MKLNVAQKILVGYVAGFVFLLIFSGLTIYNGLRIESSASNLTQQSLPGLIAAGKLETGFKTQIRHLYELYATADKKTFELRWQDDMQEVSSNIGMLGHLTEYNSHALRLDQLRKSQDALVSQFVKTMSDEAIDWDIAREQLAEFSKNADLMTIELDTLVTDVSQQTIAKANDSKNLAHQLMQVALAMTIVIFIGVLVMLHFANTQIAQPLRALSLSLKDITTRRDLTSRLVQTSNDEIGDIAIAGNSLIAEFQRLALTIDAAAQEVSRTMSTLTEVTDKAHVSLVGRNGKLRNATQDFLKDIQAVSDSVNATIDPILHRAQMKFINTHLSEIDEGTEATNSNITVLQTSTNKLKQLSENMCNQIRLLNF